MEVKKRIILLKIVFLVSLVILPWTDSALFDRFDSIEIGTEDTSFYEINTCKFSLIEYLSNDFQSTFKNHYYFIHNSNSSINCFGKFSGLALQNNIFYISIGSNSFINLIIQSLFWFTIVSFIKKDKKLKFSIPSSSLYVVLTTLILVFSIFTQKRFYSSEFYLLDLENPISYLFIFLILFFITKLISDIFIPRYYSLINYLPFLYLLQGVYTGFNFSIFVIPLTLIGIYELINYKNFKLNFTLFIFIIFWLVNVESYSTFKPDKLRGFTSSAYDYYAVLYWSLLTIFLINGIYNILKNSKFEFNFMFFKKNYSISVILIMVLGYLGANIPIINFFNYFYFGQQKIGVKNPNPFLVDVLNNNEKISWRGFFSSAETIGEFYGILILIIAISFFINKYLSKLDIFSLVVAILGLYFSDNKTVILLVSFILISYLYVNFKIPKIWFIFLILCLVLLSINIIGIQNLTYPYERTSNELISQAFRFVDINNTSSAFKIFSDAFEKNNFLKLIFGFISFISYLLNRSEVWGIFIARYNPNFSEFIFGFGPFNFANHYNEIVIKEPPSFLLPHSSILSMLIFIGFFGLFLIFLFLLILISRRKKYINLYGYSLLIFIIINLIKNDSINYLPVLILYSTLISLIILIPNQLLFRKDDFLLPELNESKK